MVLQGRGADQEAPSASSAPLRGPAPHKGDQQVIRCACCEICARKDWSLSCERVRAGYQHSTRADRWHETPAVKSAGGWVRDREADLEAFRQRHDRPASQKRDTPTRRSFEPSSNLERKRVCNREVPQLQQGFVPARTGSRKESHPCTHLSPGTTGLVETALQDGRPAACVREGRGKCDPG